MAQLLERAEKGDVTVLLQLRRLLDESPEIWRGYGDLSLQAQGVLVKLAIGNNLLMWESLMRQMAALKAELMRESPSSLEKLHGPLRGGLRGALAQEQPDEAVR